MKPDYVNDEAEAIKALEKEVRDLRGRVDELEKLCRQLDTRTIGQIRLGSGRDPYDLSTQRVRSGLKKR